MNSPETSSQAFTLKFPKKFFNDFSILPIMPIIINYNYQQNCITNKNNIDVKSIRTIYQMSTVNQTQQFLYEICTAVRTW